MEYEGSQQIVMQKEIHEKEEEKVSKKEAPVAVTRETIKKPTVLNRSSKNKSKFTLREKSQKTSRRKSASKIARDDAVLMPYIPRRVFRVFSILRHDKFFKVVSRFFKPTYKPSAWNFKTKSKNNKNH